MAEQQPEQNTNASNLDKLPGPPPFYKHFTPENIGRLRTFREEQDQTVEVEDPAQLGFGLNPDEVPLELRTLVPPSIPATGEFTVFGDVQRISTPPPPRLESYNVERLIPEEPQTTTSTPSTFPASFIRVIRSTLLNFLELTNILSANPDQGEAKVGDLKVLFFNAHQMMNELRPHQARESLISLMQDRVNGLKKQLDDQKVMQSRVDELLQTVGAVGDEQLNGVADDESSIKERQHNARADHARHLWATLDAMDFG